MRIKVDGVVSRGVKRCYISDKGHLIFVMTDNERIDLGKVSGTESGSGDMLSFIYDPEEGLRQVAFKDQLHTHTNKLLLDKYTQTEADLSDAVAKKHFHENGDVLDRITDDVYGSIESTIRQTATNTTNIRTNSIDIRTNAEDINTNAADIVMLQKGAGWLYTAVFQLNGWAADTTKPGYSFGQTAAVTAVDGGPAFTANTMTDLLMVNLTGNAAYDVSMLEDLAVVSSGYKVPADGSLRIYLKKKPEKYTTLQVYFRGRA